MCSIDANQQTPHSTNYDTHSFEKDYRGHFMPFTVEKKDFIVDGKRHGVVYAHVL
jgi:hypothetical protein